MSDQISYLYYYDPIGIRTRENVTRLWPLLSPVPSPYDLALLSIALARTQTKKAATAGPISKAMPTWPGGTFGGAFSRRCAPEAGDGAIRRGISTNLGSRRGSLRIAAVHAGGGIPWATSKCKTAVSFSSPSAGRTTPQLLFVVPAGTYFSTRIPTVCLSAPGVQNSRSWDGNQIGSHLTVLTSAI